MNYNHVIGDSCLLGIQRINFESALSDAAFKQLATMNQESVLASLSKLHQLTEIDGKRSPILTKGAFSMNFESAHTLSMESAVDHIVTAYEKTMAFIARMCAHIRDFIKKTIERIFGNKAKQALAKKNAISTIANGGIVITIPKSELSNYGWLVHSDKLRGKSEVTLAEVTGVAMELISQLEDVMYDYLYNLDQIDQLLNVVKRNTKARQYDIEGYRADYTLNGIRGKAKHFGSSGALVVHPVTYGKNEVYEVLRRTTVEAPIDALVISVRDGDKATIENYFKIASNVEHIMTVANKVTAAIQDIAGDGKGKKGKAIELFHEINATRKNNAKRKSLETLALAKASFNNVVTFMSESMNNIAAVTSSLLIGFDKLGQRLAKEANYATESEVVEGAIPEGEITTAYDLFLNLRENASDTSEVLRAINDNLRSLALMIPKYNWENPLVLTGTNFLGLTPIRAVENVTSTAAYVADMTSIAQTVNQSNDDVTLAKFDNVKSVVAGQVYFGVQWDSAGLRSDSLPVEGSLALTRGETELLVEELTTLLIRLTTAHDVRTEKVGLILNFATQAIEAKKEGKPFREEDIRDMVSYFHFFDSVFSINLIAGRLNDTVTALHSSIYTMPTAE